MDMRDNRNIAIGILLSICSVLLTSTLFLFYKTLIAEGINNDLNREYLYLLKENKELQRQSEQKEKQEPI